MIYLLIFSVIVEAVGLCALALTVRSLQKQVDWLYHARPLPHGWHADIIAGEAIDKAKR